MDYLKPYDFIQLKAFFLALKQSHFNLQQTSSTVVLDGIRTPIDRVHCLGLLRSFPDLQGEKFKDDNLLIKYLSQPSNLNRILGRLRTDQQTQLLRVLEEKPTTVATGEQPSTEASAGQAIPAQTPVGTAAGAGVPGLPSFSSRSFSPRFPGVIHNVPHAPELSKPEIFVANKSGVVREAGDPSKLVTANKGGVVKEAPPSKIFIANKSGSVVREHTITPSQGFNQRSFKMPSSFTNAAKNFSSTAQRFTRGNLDGIGRGLGKMVKGAGRGIAGPGLTSAYKGLGKVGNGGLNAFGRLSNLTGPKFGGVSKLKGFGTGKKVILAFSLFGLFFGFSLIAGIINPNSTPSSQAASISTGDLSSCQFTRGDISPTAASYQSKLLMTYFTEAETATSVPATVLAAIARVESPSSVNWTDTNLGDNCPESGDGALGIMQLVSHFSPRTDAICRDCIALGASYLNKTVDQLTQADYCNPKTSIFLGAGFILKKLSYLGYGDGTKWDPAWTNNKEVTDKMINSFYGCLNYPSCTSGPHNYGEDVWTSIQSCKPSAAYSPNGGSGIISCPLNGAATITLGSRDAGGHCTPQYQAQEAPCLSGDPTGRGSAIDVQSSDKAVFLPTLGGQNTDWTIDESGPISDSGAYIGEDLAATASYNGKSYRIRFVHLDSTSLRVYQHYPSGTFVGFYRPDQNHVHITLQEDGVFKPADLYFNLCR